MATDSATEARTNRDSIKKGFDDFKKFASTNLTRAVQYVSEKTGKAGVVTEYDADYDNLCKQLELIKVATEKMVSYIETIIEPNPNIRWETWARNKIDRPRDDPPSGHILLSSEMRKIATEFGPETQYGAYLLRCAEVEAKLAESQKRFKDTVLKEYVIPLRAFLEVDIKNILKEKKNIAVLKLDLDAAMSRAKKAQGDEKQHAAEEDLASVQADYDTQLGMVRSGLKRIVETHVNHMGYMRKFMAAQKAYFSECQAHLEDIEGGTFVMTSRGATGSSGASDTLGGLDVDSDEAYKGKLLYDHEAQNEEQLTVNAGEVIMVYPIVGDEDYVRGDYQGNQGKLLATYIEKL